MLVKFVILISLSIVELLSKSKEMHVDLIADADIVAYVSFHRHCSICFIPPSLFKHDPLCAMLYKIHGRLVDICPLYATCYSYLRQNFSPLEVLQYLLCTILCVQLFFFPSQSGIICVLSRLACDTNQSSTCGYYIDIHCMQPLWC